MTKPILLFDLDNTILDFNSGERAALSAALSCFGIEPDEEILSVYHRINVKYWEMLERGELTRSEVLEKRFDELFEVRGINSCTGKEAQLVYGKHLGEQHDFMPGAEKLLEEIYRKNDLYIVSNGCTEIQASRIADSGLEKYFKDFFISEKIGYDKPDVRFFDYCFANIPDFSADRAVIIGDSLTSDIKGGKNAGIATCWFNPGKKPVPTDDKPDFVIYGLDVLTKELSRFIVL